MNKTSFLIALSFVLLTSCSIYPRDKNHDVSVPVSNISHTGSAMSVLIDYKLTDGDVVLESRQNLVIQSGSDFPFLGLRDTVSRMKVGETVITTLPSESIYGSARTEEIVYKKQLVNAGKTPFSFSEFRLGAEAPWNGGKMRIEKIDGEYITVSYPTPHPLAGKSLTLEVEKKSAQ